MTVRKLSTNLSTKNPPGCLANHFPNHILCRIWRTICHIVDESNSNLEVGRGRPKDCRHRLSSWLPAAWSPCKLPHGSHKHTGARGSTVGWGPALQAGGSRLRFPMLSLYTIIFYWHNPSGHTVALRLTQSLTEMNIRNISWGAVGIRCVGLKTLPPSRADCLEIWEPQPPGTLRACPGLWWDCFNFDLSHKHTRIVIIGTTEIVTYFFSFFSSATTLLFDSFGLPNYVLPPNLIFDVFSVQLFLFIILRSSFTFLPI